VFHCYKNLGAAQRRGAHPFTDLAPQHSPRWPRLFSALPQIKKQKRCVMKSETLDPEYASASNLEKSARRPICLCPLNWVRMPSPCQPSRVGDSPLVGRRLHGSQRHGSPIIAIVIAPNLHSRRWPVPEGIESLLSRLRRRGTVSGRALGQSAGWNSYVIQPPSLPPRRPLAHAHAATPNQVTFGGVVCRPSLRLHSARGGYWARVGALLLSSRAVSTKWTGCSAAISSRIPHGHWLEGFRGWAQLPVSVRR